MKNENRLTQRMCAQCSPFQRIQIIKIEKLKNQQKKSKKKKSAKFYHAYVTRIVQFRIHDFYKVINIFTVYNILQKNHSLVYRTI